MTESDSDLLGVAEIAVMLGVSRQRVFQLSQREGFPEPVARLSAGTFWRTADVRTWALASGRDWRQRPRPKPPPSSDDEQ